MIQTKFKNLKVNKLISIINIQCLRALSNILIDHKNLRTNLFNIDFFINVLNHFENNDIFEYNYSGFITFTFIIIQDKSLN